jgi:hypothetical protein
LLAPLARLLKKAAGISTSPRAPYVPQRLFFLGAGFSRVAGLPLANELLPRTLRELERFQPETHVHWALEEYLDYLEAVTGKPRLAIDQVDIEDFVVYLDHEHFFGLRGSDAFSSQGNQAQLMLRWGIGRLLHTLTPDPLPDIYLRFAEGLKPPDVVATFNYDLIVERALEAVGKPYRRFPTRYENVYGTYATGTPAINSTEVVVSKLHGSIDWVNRGHFEELLDYMRATSGADGEAHLRERDPLFGDNPLVPTSDLVDGPRFADDPLSNIAVINDLDTYYDSFNMWHEYPPLILAPSQAKQLYGDAFRGFWDGLPLGGSLWGGFAIVGCSLPDDDPYVKQVLYAIGRGYAYGIEHPEDRFGPMNRIKVVNRASGAAVNELRARYRFLPDAHTDFLLNGLDDAAVDAMFAPGV